MPQVHPNTNNDDLAKAAPLRGEACLGGDTAGSMYMGPLGDDADAAWCQRSEFDILLDFLDTDGNGKVSALELADFVDSLLGTQDHKRPNGSIVFEAVLMAALRHANSEKDAPRDGPGPRPGQRPPPPLPPPPLALKTDSSKWTTTRADDDTASASIPPPTQQQHGPVRQHKRPPPSPPQQQLLLPQPPSLSPTEQQQQVPRGPSAAQLQLQPSATGSLASMLGAVTMKEIHQYGSAQVMSMDAVRNCFAELLADKDLWIRLTSSYSVMTTTLFRQLLMYSAGRLEKKFSMVVFLKTYGAFNTLPLWLPFPSLWCTRKNGILFLVYLHQLTKLQNQLGPTISSRLPLHATLVVLTMLQFIATYVPLIAFIATHAIPAISSSRTVVDFMHANPLSEQISLFGSILPMGILQFLTSSAALKLSCRDFTSLKEQCKAVFMLGDVSSEFEGYRGLTIRDVMDSIKSRVELTISRSAFQRLNALMPLVFGVILEVFRRLVRLFLVRNMLAKEPLGKVVTPFEVYALVYNIWFAYSESADCTAYLYKMRKISSVFKTLLSKEEALSQSLPWLNNHSPRNLLLWSRLRRYYQSPNCLELRWIEMHLTLVVVAAIVVTVILVVTFVQKTLLRFAPENADLQLFVVWVIPAFIYLLLALVIDVVMSASTGTEYHDGVMTLSAEAVFIADRLNNAEEIARRHGDRDEDNEAATAAISTNAVAAADSSGDSDGGDAEEVPKSRTGLGTKPSASSPPSARRPPPSESGLVRRMTTGANSGTGASELGGGGGSGSCSSSLNGRRQGSGALEVVPGGGGRGVWVPAAHYRLSRAERARLQQCQEVIKALVSYIQFNAEYITIFGVPIDTHLRNTLFSVSVTLVGAGISAFLAIVVKR